MNYSYFFREMNGTFEKYCHLFYQHFIFHYLCCDFLFKTTLLFEEGLCHRLAIWGYILRLGVIPQQCLGNYIKVSTHVTQIMLGLILMNDEVSG
jgi:hypothetical protein